MPRRKKKDDFEQSGFFRMKLKIDIEITEDDMLNDLVKKTEGKMITPEKQKFSKN